MNNKNLQNCITNCWDCRHLCQTTLFEYCLKIGGEHIELEHIRKMFDCIDVCQVAADLMTRNSENYAAVCHVCAKICDACAESCESFADDKMSACAELCKQCAVSCRSM